MRQINSRSTFAFLVVALMFSCSNIFVDAQTVPIANNEILVETVVFPQSPLSINAIEAKNFEKNEGDTQIELKYSAVNYANEKIKSVQFVVFIVDLSGRIKGGEGWTEKLNLTKDLYKESTVKLDSKLSNGDKLLLMAWKIEGQTQKFELGTDEIINSVKSRFVGELNTRKKVQLIKIANRLLQQKDTCATTLDMAKRTCGDNCVKSFECDPSTGRFRFECFSKTECEGSGEPKPAEPINQPPQPN